MTTAKNYLKNVKTLYLVNSLDFHWSLDLTTLEDNLLLQSIETPHRCPQLFSHKHNIEVHNITASTNKRSSVVSRQVCGILEVNLTELPGLEIPL